jgi:hypothetical protein
MPLLQLSNRGLLQPLISRAIADRLDVTGVFEVQISQSRQQQLQQRQNLRRVCVGSAHLNLGKLAFWDGGHMFPRLFLLIAGIACYRDR